MKTFVASLLVATAYAQSNSTLAATASNAANTVANTFKGLVNDYLQAKSESKPWNGVAATAAGGNYNLTGFLSLDTSYLGITFATFGADLSGPTAQFGDGTYNYIWF